MEKKYILFGSGVLADQILKAVGINLDIDYIIDNDKSKWNKESVINDMQYQVFPVDAIKAETLDDVEIIIGSTFAIEMLTQLESLSEALSLRLSVRCADISVTDNIPFRLNIASFSGAEKRTLFHDYSKIDTDLLIFKISDMPCAIQFENVLSINTEIPSYQGILETNGDWTSDNTIQFPHYNPTVYMTGSNCVGLISAQFSYIKPDYKKAFEFMSSFKKSLSDFSNNINPSFVAEEDYEPVQFGENDVKPIAYYLPQFHRIPQNDLWWEKGFTEWTNVTKTYPLFEGHDQPHLPIDMGFYDLDNPEVHMRQIELAKKYGIYGFCYYYYHFEETKLLEKPINRHLNNKEFDFPFCIFWDNSNWTKRWTGDRSVTLLKTGDSDAYYLSVIRDIKEFLEDPRYIRVDGKPIIILFRRDALKEPNRFSKIWRDYCRENNVGEIILLHARDDYISGMYDKSFDGTAGFLPLLFNFKDNLSHKLRSYEKGFRAKAIKYDDYFAESSRCNGDDNCFIYDNVFLRWDNSPRYRNREHTTLFHGSTPELYSKWLRRVIKVAKSFQKSKDKYIFINAWNEWAEGTHLEPDRKYGYAYLKATREVVMRSRYEYEAR